MASMKAKFSHALPPQKPNNVWVFPADCAVVGTAGRLDPIKRLDIFLAAAKQIGNALPNTRFVIAGDGTEASRLRDLAARLGLSDRVLFLGHRDDIYDVIRAMDIFVFCSDHEGLPMALLETLYLGVARRGAPGGRNCGSDPGRCEWSLGGVVRTVVPGPKLACNFSMTTHGVAFLARAGAQQVAERFTANSAADRLVALYYSCMKREEIHRSREPVRTIGKE